MATLLHRLGHGAFRRHRLVLVIWLVVLAAVLVSATAFGGKLENQFSIPGSESQRALDIMANDFPAASGTSAQIVFTAPAAAKITDPPNMAAIDKTLAEAAKAPQVAAVIAPAKPVTISLDESTALAQIQYSVDRGELDHDSLEALEQTVEPAHAAGMRVAVGGPAYGNGVVSANSKELFGVLVALVVLVVSFGSLLAAGMPLFNALIGVVVGLGGLFALTKAVSLPSTAVTLALMLGLAVGIDYALFILSRHRVQLATGMAPQESAALANATAGSAVVFAGTTVIIALVGLCVVRIPFLTVMGLAAAATVLVAVLVAITLLPAMLGFAGRRLAPKPGSRAARRAAVANPDDHTATVTGGQLWARLVTHKPLITVVAVVAALIVVAIPAKDLRLALPDNGSAAEGSTQREAYDMITEEFGPGFNGPLMLLVRNKGDQLASLAPQIAVELWEVPGVLVVAPPQYNDETGSAVIGLVGKSAPDGEATKDLVNALRTKATSMEDEYDVQISVTGSTAVTIDVSDRLSASLLPFLAIVGGLCLMLLLIVFRSLVVPLKATIGFLFSVAASFGAVVAVFDWGWLADRLDVAKTGPVVSFLPIVLIAVLFGLAMDYQVFLVSSMREEWVVTRQARPSIVQGARHASRVVTAAALIMFAVFASFVEIDDAIIKPIAFGLAFGVLIDAFVVRMTLVPAVLALAGAWAWWLPAWLDDLLPDLDIDGERLAHAGGQEATAGPVVLAEQESEVRPMAGSAGAADSVR